MNFQFIKYKYRFFLGYVMIGIFSLLIELIFYNFLSKYFDNVILNSLSSVLIGILISFWLNIRYNFKISKSKRDRNRNVRNATHAATGESNRSRSLRCKGLICLYLYISILVYWCTVGILFHVECCIRLTALVLLYHTL